MKKNNIFYKKKLLINTTSVISILIFAVLIFSSIGTSMINIVNNQDKLKTNERDIGILTGLAPNTRKNQITKLSDSSNLKLKTSSSSLQLTDYMYGYATSNGPNGEGPYKWDDPTNLIRLSNQQLPNFASGGTWTGDNRWLVCEVNDGTIYEINPDDGTITYIGGGPQSLNGLAYDPSTGNLYGCSSTHLFKIDPDDGTQTQIGTGFGTGETHIAIACDWGGTMYSWNVKFSGNSYLYQVDKTLGTATQLYSLDHSLNYAQDGGFNWVENKLYLTAYIQGPGPEIGGYLVWVDHTNGNFHIIDQFENNAEITGSTFNLCEIDTIPPVTTHEYIPVPPTGDNDWYKGPPSPTVTVTLTATDIGLGVAKTSYTLDGGLSWTDYTYTTGPPWTFTFPVSGCVQPGDFQYYSVDMCGNLETINTDPNFKVDTDPPVFNISPLIVRINDPYVEVEADVEDICSGVCMVEFFRDGSPFGSPVNAPPWVINFIGSDPPPNTMYAIAYDCAGNSATSTVINLNNLQQQSSHQSSSQQSIVPLFFQILQRLMNIR